MRNLGKWGGLSAGVAVLLLASTVGGLTQDKLALVKDRQDFMKAQGADVKAITGYSKGQGDQQAALKAVDDLLARAPKITDQFAPGTSATDFPGKTKAKPEIWTDWDHFKMIPTAVADNETKLKTAIQAGDPKAVGPALGALGKNGCGTCHSKYRLPES
jgi:cytochrome c556